MRKFHKRGLTLCLVSTMFTISVQKVSIQDRSPESLVGWQPNPGRRGAVAILLSYVFTIVACTWSILHLNIPGPSEGLSRRLWRKFVATIMTVFLPEIVLAHANVEHRAAIESLKELDNIDYLEVSYEPWSWRRKRDSVSKMLRKVFCSCSARNSETEAASELG